MSRLLIVDDHPLVRDGLRTVLSVSFDRCEVHEADSLEEALDQLERTGDYDLVLLDLHLPGQTGFSGLETLRARRPALPVVVISAECDSELVDQAVRRGAAGFIPKSLARSDFVVGLRTVLEGGVFVPASVPQGRTDSMVAEIEERVAKLTPQQRTVLGLVVAGRLNKEIAYDLSISETTVKAHVSAILGKLRVFSRTQAVILANRIGFRGERPMSSEPLRAEAC